MVVANKTSKYVWQYQAAHGTSILTAAGSASFEFGEYNEACGNWNSPFVENKAMPSWIYNSRTPTLTDLESEFPTFTHVFNPVTAQFLFWLLGTTADGTPTTVTITSLETGRKYPLTIRMQEEGGTNPQNAQAVDCHCIGLTVSMERGKAMIVEGQFAWGALEDIGDNVNLTTAPTSAGGCTKPYNGNPIVLWDTGGDNVSIPGIWKADFMMMQDWENISSAVGVDQSVYTYKTQPVQIVLSAIFQINDGWDDYVDRKAATVMTIQVKKHNATNYITYTFTNCRIQSIKKTGERNKGHYASTCLLVAEKVEAVSDWYTDNGGAPTFLTHWKTAAL